MPLNRRDVDLPGGSPHPLPTQPAPSKLEAAPHAATERAISIPVPETDARATLTVIAGDGPGRIVALTQHHTTIGRSTTADLRFDDPTISRCHARLITEPDAYVLEDVGSTNGTFLRGTRVERESLISGDRFQLGPKTVVRFAVADQLERDLLTRLVESSTRDALTGAFNRRFFEQRLEVELSYARRHGSQLAVLLLDVDHFKSVNDVHGHHAGDQALRAVAEVVGRAIRAEDLLARYGGEEFAVLARAATRLDAFRLAERVRLAVASLRVAVAGDATVAVTVSTGLARVSELPEPRTGAAIMKLADTRLYRAKASGRNSICAGD